MIVFLWIRVSKVGVRFSVCSETVSVISCFVVVKSARTNVINSHLRFIVSQSLAK